MFTSAIKTTLLFSFLLTSIIAQSKWTWQFIPHPDGYPNLFYYHKQTDQVYITIKHKILRLNYSNNTWELVNSGSGTNIPSGLTISSFHIDLNGDVFAGIFYGYSHYYSTDNGTNWNAIEYYSLNNRTVNAIGSHPNGTVFLGTNYGLVKTTDRGKTWAGVEGFEQPVNSLATLPNGDMLAGTAGWIYKSTDGGITWIAKTTGTLATLKRKITYDSKGTIYSCSAYDFYRSDNGGESWISLKNGFPLLNQYTSSSFSVAISKDDVLYLSTGVGGRYFLVSSDKGTTWNEEMAAQAMSAWQESDFNNAGILYGRPLYNHLAAGTPNPVSVEEEPEFPSGYELFQNYPNPFNPSTTIQYSIPSTGTKRISSLYHVTLKVYDLLGREAATLVDGEKSPGNYKVEWKSLSLPSGVYYYRLTAGNFLQTRKMVLLR
ncbi:MAG: T9SS type A sorting domain-containing protein [Melioribacteraceae bacterium]|nr:T9SS type A sorting domain-containing protein [Melioribacteraceae bacterium]